jgi:hypothetical protein
MAVRYLWSGAGSSTSPYTGGWDQAATTYAAVAAVWASGDEIYMAKDHQETAAGLTLTGATGDLATTRVQIWSMERTGSTYDPQTSSYNFQSTGAGNPLTLSDYWDAHGIYFESAADEITINTSSRLKDCTFKMTSAGSGDEFYLGLSAMVQSCTFITGTSNQNATFDMAQHAWMLDSVWETGGSDQFGVGSLSRGAAIIGGKFTTEDSGGANDFSSFAGGLYHIESDFFSQVKGSHGGSSQAVFGQPVENAFVCDAAGASYGRPWMTQTSSVGGFVQPVTALSRDGGWVDSETGTSLSWKMTADTSSVRIYGAALPSPWITGRLDGPGSYTFTVYGLHTFTTPNINEIVMHVFYLGTANSQRWHLASTEGDPDATTALTSDTSTWTGYTSETKFKLSKTVTVNHPGEWMVMFWLKKYEASKFVWICPKVEIT